MSSGSGPYVVMVPIDTRPAANLLETVTIASDQTVDLGGGLSAHVETSNR